MKGEIFRPCPDEKIMVHIMLNKLSEMMNQIDAETFKKNVEKAKEFANTEKGKELINGLVNKNQGKVLQSLENLNTSEMKLSERERNKLISELTKNPDIIKKIEEFLK